MKNKKNISSIILVFMTVFVTICFTSSCSEDGFEFNNEYKTLATRSVDGSGEGLYPFDRIIYANCGMWTLAQLMGNADNQVYYNKVITAAENSIYWDEESEMEKLTSDDPTKAISSGTMMVIITKIIEMNNLESGLSQIQNLESAFPNTTISDSIQAQAKIIELAQSSNKTERLRGAVVGLYTIVNNKTTPHWVRLRDVDLDTDEIIVDDVNAFTPNTSNPYHRRYNLVEVSSLMYRQPETSHH